MNSVDSEVKTNARVELVRKMLTVRRVEEKLLDLFTQGVLNGTTHTSLGQETCSVGVISALDLEKDLVVSNHRCHGHYLVYGGSMESLFAEIMGRELGMCRGIGGSQHIQYRNFYSNGILGGTMPLITGMAVAEKWKGSGAIGVVFAGDGAMAEGAVYESLNFAALWGAPVLYVVEANQIAQSTPIEFEISGNLPDRFRAFQIPVIEMDANDPVEVNAVAARLVDEVRSTSTPRALVLKTFRLGPHSKGDDPRSSEELAIAQVRDPLNSILASLPAETVAEWEREIGAEIDHAVAAAMASPVLSRETFEALQTI